MRSPYQTTLYACFTGYIVQAVVNNFVPLLFLTFQRTYGISLEKITLLVTINFGLQLVVDLLSAGFIDKIGYRASAVAAHVFAAAGLILLPVLPDFFQDPFVGIQIAVMVYACGGGLLEVLVSPIAEACPTAHKAKTMSLLHSFYCWGHVGVVLLSTVFFSLFGIENWKILALIWAVIPAANAVAFARVPLASPEGAGETEKKVPVKRLVRRRGFWLLMLLMFCAGASEQSVSQWASAFAERGLGIEKALGDLTGPMLFAGMMGLSRTFYGKFGERIRLARFMRFSTLLCVCSYLVISLSPAPVFGLIGCGLCGLSVGILWPGTFSMAAVSQKGGGTALFAFLALAGDLGCSAGPTFVGLISGAAGDSLKTGILAGAVFPVTLLLVLLRGRREQTESGKELRERP